MYNRNVKLNVYLFCGRVFISFDVLNPNKNKISCLYQDKYVQGFCIYFKFTWHREDVWKRLPIFSLLHFVWHVLFRTLYRYVPIYTVHRAVQRKIVCRIDQYYSQLSQGVCIYFRLTWHRLNFGNRIPNFVHSPSSFVQPCSNSKVSYVNTTTFSPYILLPKAKLLYVFLDYFSRVRRRNSEPFFIRFFVCGCVRFMWMQASWENLGASLNGRFWNSPDRMKSSL